MAGNVTAFRRWGPIVFGFALGSACASSQQHGGGGCGQDVGADSDLVGAACRDDGDCVERCLRGGNFPDGMCSLRCDHDGECPDGSWCVEDSGGVCLPACEFDGDCGRRHYDCRDRKREGEGGKRPVCID